MRLYNDTTTKEIDERYVEIPGYKYYVENSFNGYLYLDIYYKDFLKLKILDSITYFDPKTNTYKKEKLKLNVFPNYYDDGYMYSSPTRGIKRNEFFTAFDDNGILKPDHPPKIIYNKSSFPADKNGLYDLAGNVSEMIAEKGMVMGGSWDSTIDELRYDWRCDHENRLSLVGFRIVAERIE